MPRSLVQNLSPVIGLVLAGGQSTRLGQDKVRLRYQGQTLLERAAQLLETCCHQVVVSCRDSQLASYRWPVLVDATQRIGPLGGIVTALRQLGGPVLALACDLPFMEQDFLTALIQARSQRPANCVLTTWQERGASRIQPLVAIYEPDALPLLEASMDKGLFKLHKIILPTQRQTLVYEPAQSHVFFNINYPQDLKKLHQG